MSRNRWMLAGLACMLAGACMPSMAQSSAAAKRHGNKVLQAQLHDVQSKVSAARDRNSELQAKVAKMERQNAERQERLKQRDDEIAALQQKIGTAGGTAIASSAGH